jgi:transcription elongation GreA/GreB family factor
MKKFTIVVETEMDIITLAKAIDEIEVDTVMGVHLLGSKAGLSLKSILEKQK